MCLGIGWGWLGKRGAKKVIEKMNVVEVEGSPFSEDLKEYLEKVRQHSPKDWLAFWLRCGSDLSEPELMDLKFEHLLGNRIFGQLAGRKVEAELVQEAVEAIRPFLQPSGRILNRDWPRNLRTMLRFAGAPDFEEIRAALGGVQPARRSKRRSRPASETAKRLPPIGGNFARRSRADVGEPEPNPDCQPQATPRNATSDSPSVDTAPAAEVARREGVEPKQAVPIVAPKARRSSEAERREQVAVVAHMKVSRAAVLIDKSDRWLKEQIKAGHIKGGLIGEEWMVEVQSLNEYIKNGKIGARKETR